MANPPTEDPFVKWCRQMGIDPATVQVVKVQAPQGRERYGAPANDNVIPFPKSGNARGKPSQPRTPSVRDVLLHVIKEIDAGEIDADMCALSLAARDGGMRYHRSTGMNSFERIGLLTEAVHESLIETTLGRTGEFDDDTPGGAA